MILAAMALVAATAVHARNEAVMLPLADVVKLGLEQGKLDGSVSFHLSGASTPAISEKLGDDVSNKKTNGVGKDDATACNWAALSALMAFEAKAKQKGANAVVDLHSFNKKQSTRDPINFECRAGNVMAGVTFKGTYARVGR
ncbi:excinuclease ATPase subunit [Delftia tsuruhatensis]|nr:excinuclease ATPase subunit [Delftia tsuruhatensis]MDH2232372.1 excinuclease ATPase subunit [Delftia tsuruhatensis]